MPYKQRFKQIDITVHTSLINQEYRLNCVLSSLSISNIKNTELYLKQEIN